MAGSTHYLNLLDMIEKAHSHVGTVDPTPYNWNDLDVAWNELDIKDTATAMEGRLFALAGIALSIYGQERKISFADVILTAKELHIGKNAGYAGANNTDPWANFRLSKKFGVLPVVGVYVRMSDKYIRITNLRHDATNERVGEAVHDTLMDLAAYALIALCLLRERRLDA